MKNLRDEVSRIFKILAQFYKGKSSEYYAPNIFEISCLEVELRVFLRTDYIRKIAFLIFLKSYSFCKYSNGCHTFNSISLALEQLASQLIYQNTQGRWRKTVVTKNFGCGKWGGQPPPLKTEI